MQAHIVLLPGDGIGPEVVAQGERILLEIGKKFGHTFRFTTHLIGGCAIDQCGNPLPDETLAACKQSQAVLLGAVGGPKWDDPNAKTRPEAGLLKIRKELGLFANLRPMRRLASKTVFSGLRATWFFTASPIRSSESVKAAYEGVVRFP